MQAGENRVPEGVSWVALDCRHSLSQSRMGQWTVMDASVTSHVLGWLKYVCDRHGSRGVMSHGEDKVSDQGGEDSGSPRGSVRTVEEEGGRENWGEEGREGISG